MVLVCLHTKYKYTLLFMLYVTVNVWCGFRDDVENNDGQVDFSKYKDIFKLGKYNEIWRRAVKTLPENKLGKLKKVLKKLDRIEIDLKHIQKDDGETKQHVKEHLNDVLREYGLLEEDIPILDHHFNDERINQLWKEAIEEGQFTEDELHSLHKEMRHMEGRMEEMHALVKETEHLRGKVDDDMENDPRNAENLVEPMDDNPDLDVEQLDKLQSQLEHKKAVVSEQVQYLEEKVRSKPKREKTEFTDDRVTGLWDSAQKANFTADELETFKDELRHFQKHVDKLNHWEKQDKKLESGERQEKEHIMHVKEKIDEHKRKVKKYHMTMVNKMKDRRDEL